MIYRKATENDIDQLTRFRIQQLIDEGQYPNIIIDKEINDYFLYHFKNDSLLSLLCIKDDIPIAAGAVIFMRNPPSFLNRTGYFAYINSMYTDKDFRRQGIAVEIITRLIEEIKIRKVSVITLRASEYGAYVYKKMGFTDEDGHMVLKI